MIIEIAGVAGAGKTSIEKLMFQIDPGIKLFAPPYKTTYIPKVIQLYYYYLNTCLHNKTISRKLPWQELKIWSYLTLFPRLIREQALNGKDILINPGSVYWLTALQKFGSGIYNTEVFKHIWNKGLLEWAHTLRMVIFLEAPIETIIDRLLVRDVWRRNHQIDHLRSYFSTEQEAYVEVISAMQSVSDLIVHKFRSDQVSSEEIATEILRSLCDIRSR